MAEGSGPTTVEELDDLIAKVARAPDPYAAAWEVWRGAMPLAGTSETAHDLWLLWAGLQDRAERAAGEGEEAEAGAVLRRAATEWASAKDDPVDRQRYFDHWLYGVIGYERPSG